ncbi:unnamed protein product [Adineta ricciae]|uniref:Uncharacterized protein n=1 Tax=Adineta ricciae TaxID=249248 RepID=A0A814E7V7_ADIRI|nr:unnamed protein product [Adineta ricciae]CAF1056135.1 unnamed protein product [Adineta ricciae]
MDSEPRKTVDNTSSSYLSLKAELLRKKQDVQRASSSSASSSSILDNLQSTSSSLKLKTKAELDVEVANPSKRKKKNEETSSSTPAPQSSPSTTLSRADEIAFAKSRAILEAKAKLYDEIMSNSEMKLLAEEDVNDEDDKSFLVDFERKIYETNQPKAEVEYTDSFGRTRLVTAEEYEQLKAAERRKPREEIPSKPTSEEEIRRVERLHREQMRSKWESDMDALRNKTDVHYEDVLFDEKREHGIGYYKFSTDDKQRAEQMATLNELRANTKAEQMKVMEEKEKRQSSMSERLNQIRLRKAKEMGINLPGTNQNGDRSKIDQIPTNDIAKNEDEQNVESNVSEKNEVQETKVIEAPSLQQETQTIRIQQQTLVKSSTPNSSSSPFAYPFPVMRTNH